MSSAEVQPLKLKLSIPGKVFILGEYLALEGGPALVGALDPRFIAEFTPSSRGFGFHPDSPAGRLTQSLSLQSEVEKLRWEDPHQGLGGLGGSTAEFLAVAALGHRLGKLSWEPKALWEKYRELHDEGSEAHVPSGLDLVAQHLGGVIDAEFSLKRGLETRSGGDALERGYFHFVVFSAAHLAARKVATHEHLRQAVRELKRDCLEDLDSLAVQGQTAWRQRDATALGRALGDYADVLREYQLELPAAFEDRRALAKIPGVLGVKGCGAGLSDIVLALVSSEKSVPELCLAAESRGLRCLTRRWRAAAGARFEESA